VLIVTGSTSTLLTTDRATLSAASSFCEAVSSRRYNAILFCLTAPATKQCSPSRRLSLGGSAVYRLRAPSRGMGNQPSHDKDGRIFQVEAKGSCDILKALHRTRWPWVQQGDGYALKLSFNIGGYAIAALENEFFYDVAGHRCRQLSPPALAPLYQTCPYAREIDMLRQPGKIIQDGTRLRRWRLRIELHGVSFDAHNSPGVCRQR